MTRSRRQVLKLLAAGSAAALMSPTAGLAAAVRKRSKRPPAPAAHAAMVPPAVHAEVEKQKKDLASALKTIRDFPLPPGSPMAFVFKPLRPQRGGKGR
jgi:hypothetical protein